jgi:hypothetical protein
MLYVELKDNAHISWHVGEMPPKDMLESSSIFTITVEDVVMIQADNDELDYIIDKFGIAAMRPKNSRVVKWYGDIAKFIVGNL